MSEITTKELAELAGVNNQRISQWAKEGLHAAKIRVNCWDREKALAWVEARRAANTREAWNGPEIVEPSGPTVTAQDLLEERCGLLRVQKEGGELRNALLRGEVITRQLADQTLAELGMMMLEPLDEWVRAGGTPAQIAKNQEVSYELRRAWVRASEHVRRTLDAGEDLSPTRVRLPGRMGG